MHGHRAKRKRKKTGPAADEDANKKGKGAENGNPLGRDFSSAPVLHFLHVCVSERERETERQSQLVYNSSLSMRADENA